MSNPDRAILVLADALDRPLKQIALLGRRKLTIGRDAMRDVIITDPEVERLHCVLYTLNGEWCLMNIAPAGATTVDDRPFFWKRMAPGRVASLGSIRLWVTYQPQRIGARVAEIEDFDLQPYSCEPDQQVDPVRPVWSDGPTGGSAFLEDEDFIPLMPEDQS